MPALTASERTRLSVNVNKVALLRNTRHIGIPSVVRAATLCLQAGADGITVHPRPDERHIRAHDVHDLAALMQQWPGREYNIEGNPTQNLMAFIRAVRPNQATFVPDSENQFTSDHGWDLTDFAICQNLREQIAECHALGVRVSLFMDAETYAAAWASGDTDAKNRQLQRFAQAAQAALDAGLQVNAGHDLNQDNLTGFLRTVPGVSEVSIGHAFMADALEAGYDTTVKNYLRCISEAFPS